MDPIRELRTRVVTTLTAAGEQECPIRRTPSTGRIRYLPGGTGFRMHVSPDPAFAPPEERGARYVGVGCDGRSRRALERYATTLRAAGFDVRIAGTAVVKYPRVWITTPVRLDALTVDVRASA